MTKPTKADLDEVLKSFAVSGTTSDPKALREWIGLYPQFERELKELAARPPPDEESLPALPGEKARVRAGVERLRASLDKLLATAAPEPIAGLFAEATKQGYSPDAFAEKVGLPMALMAMLEQRHFRFASIPRSICSALSHALGVSAEAIAAFLDGPPLSPGMAFKSKKPPKMPEQVDFNETFAKDPDVTKADGKRWEGLL